MPVSSASPIIAHIFVVPTSSPTMIFPLLVLFLLSIFMNCPYRIIATCLQGGRPDNYLIGKPEIYIIHSHASLAYFTSDKLKPFQFFLKVTHADFYNYIIYFQRNIFGSLTGNFDFTLI